MVCFRTQCWYALFWGLHEGKGSTFHPTLVAQGPLPFLPEGGVAHSCGILRHGMRHVRRDAWPLAGALCHLQVVLTAVSGSPQPARYAPCSPANVAQGLGDNLKCPAVLVSPSPFPIYWSHFPLACKGPLSMTDAPQSALVAGQEELPTFGGVPWSPHCGPTTLLCCSLPISSHSGRFPSLPAPPCHILPSPATRAAQRTFLGGHLLGPARCCPLHPL
eukprot:GGOE01008223.1.p2 GENE.GGOE01008223.1~~GGOE01008223.1.p2  ORF type:complete len:218 (+),score=1.39 GGOE01008223.1:692-1345(+)